MIEKFSLKNVNPQAESNCKKTIHILKKTIQQMYSFIEQFFIDVSHEGEKKIVNALSNYFLLQLYFPTRIVFYEDPS